MRIAFVSREYPPATAKGGLGSQTFLKARGMAERGHQVYVISQAPDANPRELMDGPVHVRLIAGLETRFDIHNEAVEWLTYSVEVAVALSRLDREAALDVVDFPEWGGEGYVYLLNRLAGSRRPRTAVHIHGPLAMFLEQLGWPDADSVFSRVGAEMEGASLRMADAVFSSSRYSADHCVRRYGLSRDGIPVIHTGVDIGHFAPRPGAKASRPTILFAGKITPSKGVLELVGAAERLRPEFPHLRLRMVGRPDADLVTKLDRPGLVEIPGFVGREQLPEAYSNAHVFAAPSLCEGGPGFVYLEAMACGVPVIGCRDTGAEEVIEDGVNGFLVPRGDSAALERALRALLSDEALREKMGGAARRHVESQASSRRCLDRLEEFYRDLAGGGPFTS